MAETTSTMGVGVADVQHAALVEARRLMKEAKGDRDVAATLLVGRLCDLGWVSEAERDVLQQMHEIGVEAARRQKSGAARPAATAAYLRVRGLYDDLLAAGHTGPVALALAGGHVGSYEPVVGEDGTTVVYAKSNRSYASTLGAAGAAIGGALGGGAGAAIGGAVGTVVGTIVDDCKD
ncbi:hypothetical protein SAMN04488570_0102 [Nocardioides scoriae]|uniref:Uncharacterized protein n=1 Tax=Nocardioides scoriae TaxID=642780 RepID=A0A1H1L8R6_9ACTN|nr:hypothetical protein [Nocardioides scoriae]SDR70896.1 hypothetical protein SAMN04488570_0102 [Nocardioides scoriae]